MSNYDEEARESEMNAIDERIISMSRKISQIKATKGVGVYRAISRPMVIPTHLQDRAYGKIDR
jgi:hypothetical protein